MRKECPKCGRMFKNNELVELTVIAPYKELKSEVVYSIGKPVDAYPETLVHHECFSGD